MAIELTPSDIDMYKAYGSFLGAVAALIYARPFNLRDMIGRFVFSVIAGFVLYFAPMEFFGWHEIRERFIAGAMLMSFLSWFVAGAFVKFAVSKSKIE